MKLKAILTVLTLLGLFLNGCGSGGAKDSVDLDVKDQQAHYVKKRKTL